MGFRQNAQRYTLALQPTNAYAANGIMSLPLKNLGYLKEIVVIATIAYTVVVGGGSANAITGRGKQTGNPTPFDLFAKFQLFNNQNNPLVDVSGWGLYLHNQAQRGSFDPMYLTGNTSPVTNNPFTTQPTGAVVTGTYVIPFVIPVAYKPSMQSGLLFMQNQQNNMRLDITFGPGTFLTLAGGATATVNSISIDAQQVYYMPGSDTADDQPDTSFTYKLIEKTYDITGTGEFTAKPDLVQNRFIQRMYAEFVNNSAGMTQTEISNMRLQVSGSDNIANTTWNQQQLQAQRFLGRPLPRGLSFWPFDGGMGVPEFADGIDVVDLSRVTEFAHITTIASGTALTSPYARYLYEYLEL